MGYINTAVVRDKEGKILSYADYYSNQSQPEWITELAKVPGNTINTTWRKDTKPPNINYAGELDGRKAEAETAYNTLLSQRDSIVPETNTRLKTLAQTTNNPYIASGGREISRRRAAASLTELTNIESNLQSNYDLLNTLKGTNVPSKKGTTAASRSAKAAADVSAYQNRNSDVKAYAQQSGIVITSPPPPTYMSREQQTAYNKSLINAHVSISNPKKEIIYKQSDTGFPEVTNTIPFKNQTVQSAPPVQKQTLQKASSQTYVITDKNGNVQRQPTLDADQIRAYQNIGSKVEIETSIQKYKVTTPEGKERVFTTKEAADKFRSNYGSIRETQGPVRPSGIAGSLVNVFGVKPEAQGPNLNQSAFFVGADAQGYTIDTTRPIKPTISTSDLFGNNPLTMRLDKIYELNKPVDERSDVQRVGPGGFSNREIGEITAALLNRLSEGKDTITATGKALKGEKAFEWQAGFLGVPVYAPIEKTKKIETTLDRLASGKPINVSNKNERYSLYGSAFTFAGELYGFGAGVKGGTKAVEAASLAKKTGSFTKAGAVKKAESLLSEGLISGSTKLDNDYYIIARGGGGKGLGISTDIKSTLVGETTFSRVPKDVNVLQSGEKIAQQVEKINQEIEKLRVFTNKNRFDQNLVQKTEQKILELENKRNALQNTPSLLPGEAKYPVSIIEFGSTPKVTQIGKAVPIEKAKPGSTIFVEGTVPRQNLFDIGLSELPKTASTEFGISTKPGQTNALYQGIVTESNLPKLIEAEKLGFIRAVAEGRTAPLGALLKGQTNILRDYAGIKTATTRIPAPPSSETVFSWKSLSRQPEIFDPFKVPKGKIQQKIEPIISIFSKTDSDSIRTPTEFGIVNKGNIRPGESRGVTGIGSKSLENFAQDILKPVGERVSAKSKTFNFGIGESKGTGGSSGKGASISLDDAFGAAKSYIQSKPTPPQDILFSGPRGLLPQYHGVISDNTLAYPQGTPEKIKKQFKIDTGLETNTRLKTSQTGEGDYFNRFGLEVIGQTKKRYGEKENTIDIFVQTPKEGQGLKDGIISITGLGLGQTPITGTKLDTTPVQGLKTTPVTDLITDPITDIITDPIPERPYTGFNLGVFGIGFPGFGSGRGDGYRRKKGKKKYIVSSIDPLTPGSIVTAGVAEQQVSRSKSIYGKLDIQLGKARRKNQPKQRQKKDPFKL